MRSGVNIFFQAVHFVLIHPLRALTIAGPVFIVLMVLDFWALSGNSLAGLLLAWGELMGVAIIAVQWHRFVVRAHSSADIASPRRGLIWHYLMDWLVISVAVAVPMILLFSAFAMLSGDAEGLFGNDALFLSLGNLSAVNLVILMPLAVLFWAMTYVILRISLTLPTLAVRGTKLGFRQGWRLSAPLARPLIVTSGLTLFAIVVIFDLQTALFDRLYDAFDVGRMSETLHFLAITSVAALSSVVQSLIGAGTLTEIYMRLDALREGDDAPLA